MASNKNALIRYNTIDKCLRNRNKQWTLESLMEACSDALYEFEGKDELVSKRTIQLDIQNMRSEKLGYNAPIEVYDKKFYRYTDPDYSIKNIPLNENDLQAMNDAIQILKQFQDFSAFRAMNGVLHKLEDSIIQKQKSIIHLDKNEQLKGLEHIDPCYRAILNKKVLQIHYKSFQAREAMPLKVHPQLLKEYNNRWFLIAWNEKMFLTLALDRMEFIEEIDTIYIDKNVEGDIFFKDVIGVTVTNQKIQRIIFKVNRHNAPYVKTKPFHHTQKLLNEENGICTFQIEVQPNFELERMILGFGDGITVLSPESLRQRIHQKLKQTIYFYEKEVTDLNQNF